MYIRSIVFCLQLHVEKQPVFSENFLSSFKKLNENFILRLTEDTKIETVVLSAF